MFSSLKLPDPALDPLHRHFDPAGAAVGLLFDDAVADCNPGRISVEGLLHDRAGNGDAVSDGVELVASGCEDVLVTSSCVVAVKGVLHAAPSGAVCLLAVRRLDAVAVEHQDGAQVEHVSQLLHVLHRYGAEGQLELNSQFDVAEGFFDCVDFFGIKD